MSRKWYNIVPLSKQSLSITPARVGIIGFGGKSPIIGLYHARALIAEQLKDTPEKSNRQIAEGLKVSHHTVTGVREELENGGQIAHHEKRVDKRGTMPLEVS
jgi:hypothetical protein